MTYSEKYRISIKPFLKYTDCLNLIGTNTKIFTKAYFNDMVKTLEKKYDSRFGPWGIPNRYAMDYLGLDIELLRLNAEREEKEQKRTCILVWRLKYMFLTKVFDNTSKGF